MRDTDERKAFIPHPSTFVPRTSYLIPRPSSLMASAALSELPCRLVGSIEHAFAFRANDAKRHPPVSCYSKATNQFIILLDRLECSQVVHFRFRTFYRLLIIFMSIIY